MITMTDIYNDIKTEYLGQIKTNKDILDLALGEGKTFAGRPAWIIYTVYGIVQIFTPPMTSESFNVFGYSEKIIPLIENKLKKYTNFFHSHPLAGAFPTQAGILAPLINASFSYPIQWGTATTTTIGTGPYDTTRTHYIGLDPYIIDGDA